MRESNIEKAGQLLCLDQKYLQPFSEPDPFNAGNVLTGYLSMKPDHRYGALAILDINGESVEQVVLATPKLHYPFGKDGAFHFPKARKIEVYEKLDGTNVTSYRYFVGGQEFVTYKLRLFPVLRNGRWGAFLDYWKELLQRYPSLGGLTGHNGCSLSFEMYGSRNAHLIRYDVDLDVALLFGIGQGKILPPTSLVTHEVPSAGLVLSLGAQDDPVSKFGELRQTIEAGNKKISDEEISGSEGAVWYVLDDAGTTSMWKCKPESVEQIHWATGINKVAVLATCWNAFESSDILDYSVLEPLLLEEYQQDDIDRFRPHIDECIAKVNEEQAFKQRVRAVYRELQAKGFDITTNKGAVMRELSKVFPKERMSKVYSSIAK